MSITLSSLRPLALATAVALLTACGSDNNSSSSASGIGTLTDAAIAGVSYRTSSGITGVTDAAGKFRYNPGDTVTFRLGSLVLGTIPTTGQEETVTPIQLVNAVTGLTEQQKENLVTNLLVLLQSVDADGNPDNGIDIPAAVATALTTAVADTLADSLKDTLPASFVADGDLLALAGAAGESAYVPTPAEALQHFENQFLKQLAGTYSIRDNDSGDIIVFRFRPNGSYIMGEYGPTSYDGDVVVGSSGIEVGSIVWNPVTGEISADVGLDTNGEWGLSHPLETEKIFFQMDGANLRVRTEGGENETFVMTRIENSNGSVVGAWAYNYGETPAYDLNVQQFVFFSDGVYMMLDPLGDTEIGPEDPSCGDPGIEIGNYRFSGGVLEATGNLADHNGCAGLHDVTLENPFAVFDNVSVNLEQGGVIQGPVGEHSLLLVNPRHTVPDLL